MAKERKCVMTKEMKHELKMKFLRETKEKSVSCLRAMGADSKDFEPCSWEGVMTMLSDVMRHSTYDKASAAIMAASAWVWANKECEIRESIAQMDEMLVKEIEAGGGSISLGGNLPIKIPKPVLDKLYKFLETETVE